MMSVHPRLNPAVDSIDSIELENRGDFYVASGAAAEAVAKALGLVVTPRSSADDTPTCGIPVHRLADDLIALRDAGFSHVTLRRSI